MTYTIQLTIQEMISDHEKLIRCHERLDALLDFEKATDMETVAFYGEMTQLIEKYIPNYLKHVSEDYASKDSFDRGMELYGMLYENFREMFCRLI